MLNRLFPQRADNTNRGYKLGLWFFALVENLCGRPRSDLPVPCSPSARMLSKIAIRLPCRLYGIAS
jgi:hypothetical protein